MWKRGRMLLLIVALGALLAACAGTPAEQPIEPEVPLAAEPPTESEPPMEPEPESEPDGEPFWYAEDWLENAPPPLEPEIPAGDDLEGWVSYHILAHGQSSDWRSQAQVESHTILLLEEDATQAVVYTVALYEEYVYSGAPIGISGHHIPTVLTFAKDTQGHYTLSEYWEAGDGGDYWLSIQEKYPEELWDLMDTQLYIEQHLESNRQKALAYFQSEAFQNQQ